MSSGWKHIAVIAAMCCGVAAGCSDTTDEPPPKASPANGTPIHLVDSTTFPRSCNPITETDAELFGGVLYVWHDQPVPDGLRYLSIVAESRLDYRFTPAVLTSIDGEIPPDFAILNSPDWDEELTTTGLPAAAPSENYAVGAIVEVPKDGEQTPEQPALIVTGIIYELDGVEHSQTVNHAVWISRMEVTDPEFCSGFGEHVGAIDAEFGIG
jgi:hypothetical protein